MNKHDKMAVYRESRRFFEPQGFARMLLIFVIFCLIDAQKGVHSYNDIGHILKVSGHEDTFKGSAEDFHIFCHKPNQKWQWLRLWSSLTVSIKTLEMGEILTVIGGKDKEEVKKNRELSNSWGKIYNHLSPWAGYRKLSPFNESCLGIQSSRGFQITSEIYVFDPQYVSSMLFGVILFFLAPRLSGNFVFHYSTGVIVGVLASLLILVYILSRLIPRKGGAITVLVSGWAFSLYILNWVVSNFLEMRYKEYLICYVVCAALLSFAVCYYFGPVTNQRTIKLLQWFMQLIALIFIYCGTHHEAAAVIIIVFLLTLGFIPDCVMAWLPSFGDLFRRKPRVRLLTVDEYEEQAREETIKALQNLREYCRSPQCKPWKMVSRLESPKRFADFVAGEAHLSREELSAYDTDISMEVDDSSEDDDMSISFSELNMR